MIDFFKVFKNSETYRILQRDKRANKLSHAYLFVIKDKTFSDEYLRIISKIIMCSKGEPCFTCRDCKLIEEDSHSDVLVYPKGDKGLITEEIESVIEETYIKPIEGEKKLFILKNADNMNLQAQNKLLKTLEEPPKNVHILLSCSSSEPLIKTILSRVKKIEMDSLDNEVIFNALKEDFPDGERLKEAIFCGNGTIGEAVRLYEDKNLKTLLQTAKDTLINMNSSRDVLEFSVKIERTKTDVTEFINVLEYILEDFLYISEGKNELVKNKNSFGIYQNTKGFLTGATIYALEKITEARKMQNFNVNDKSVLEWLLFQILEGKYKWQKL